MVPRDLIFDWNLAGAPEPRPIELDDETLRDGLQSPSVQRPSIEEKLQMLHYMEQLGMHSANIGLPGAGPQVLEDVKRLAAEMARAGMHMEANCAARTLQVDIEPIAEASQHAGIPIEASVFIGSSPIRQFAEDWTLDEMLRHTETAVTCAVDLGLPVMYVTEDTTRATPEALRRLYSLAIECGARRICLADTVGHATPEGTRNLVMWARTLVGETREEVKIDWHGHNDRGLGLINALTAAFAGADRLHGTALGIGERVGNASMDQILINLKLYRWIDRDLSVLADYCDLASRMTGVEIPCTYPVMGADAYRTGTGVHAAAIIKALRKGDEWLANRVYSGVPSDEFGRRQIIELGPMSGQSNVVYWLEERNLKPTPELVAALFDACKSADRILPEEAAYALVASHAPNVG
ncbi:MAG TPA: LeuA family protein [Chloroflexota bacterium]|nr:LeuA family protein [Chloroflexota bacterium]